jgi:hypothetical protein
MLQFRDFALRFLGLPAANPALAPEIPTKTLDTAENEGTLGEPRGQPVCVVKVGCEAEERDDRSEFVQDEEGGYVREGRSAEGARMFVQEGGETAVYAVDAGLGGCCCGVGSCDAR